MPASLFAGDLSILVTLEALRLTLNSPPPPPSQTQTSQASERLRQKGSLDHVAEPLPGKI